jgi:hypothetical protein
MKHPRVFFRRPVGLVEQLPSLVEKLDSHFFVELRFVQGWFLCAH